VDYDASHVQKAPFIIEFRPPGAAEYIQTPLAGIFFYVPFQAGTVGVAGNRGKDKKIRPKIKASHVHYYYIPSVRAGEEFPEFYRFPKARNARAVSAISLQHNVR
jgi:hypothetical protein